MAFRRFEIADCFLVAALSALCAAALVIIVHSAGMTRTAFTNHHTFTLAAEKLCCQQIILFCFCHCGSMAVLLHAFLHTVEQVFRNDSRNAALNYNILIAILANVFAVFRREMKLLVLKGCPLFVLSPRALKSSTIERTDLLSAYFSNTSTTNGAAVGSITSFYAFLSNR